MRMVKSSPDMMGIIGELNYRRLPRVAGKRAKLRGGQLKLSADQLSALQTVRRLHHRFASGDFRHDTDSEEGQVLHVMNMLVQWHAEDNGHPLKPFEQKPDLLRHRGRLPLDPTTYQQVLQRLAEGLEGSPGVDE